jgi:Raf kinase inhibitor-like YbhB/YbcL family protein
MSSDKCHNICRIPAFAGMGLMASIFLLTSLCLGAMTSAHGSEAKGGKPMTLQLSSQAFSHNDSIPMLYTCDGRDFSPPLSWSGLPPGTKSLALIVDDPDAPDPRAPKMTWVHWVLYNIPTEAKDMEENAGDGGLPAGTMEGVNDWGRTGYGGPCPPIGRHRYFYKLYALGIVLPDLDHPKKEELLQVMRGHILGQAELIGTYER